MALADATVMRAFALLLLGACVDPTSTESMTADSYAGAELVADVAPVEGRETIRATISQVTITDANGAVTTLLYRAPHAELAKIYTFDAAHRRYKESP